MFLKKIDHTNYYTEPYLKTPELVTLKPLYKSAIR